MEVRLKVNNTVSVQLKRQNMQLGDVNLGSYG